MYGPKESAVLILEEGKNRKRGNSSNGDEAVFIGEEDDESSEYSYSDEQHEMANELLGAVDAGNTQGILEAIHGISMSYD